MHEFFEKTILVTGASRGLGRQIALDYGLEGAKVCVNYNNSGEDAENVVSQIEASGGKAVAYKADISNSRQVNSMVDDTLDTLVPIDILIHNAGLSIDRPFLDLTEEDWDSVNAVNLKGPFLVSQAV